MDFVYSRFDSDLFRRINLERLTKLFLQALNRRGGDVRAALEALERTWLHNNIERRAGISFQEFRDHLEEQGLLDFDRATGNFRSTLRTELTLQKQAFEEVFGNLKGGEIGNHPTARAGGPGERLSETRPYEFGDAVQDIDFTGSIANALRRTGFDSFAMAEEDLETCETEFLTSSATVILIDISHSMVLYGEDRITPAKMVALALVEYIRQRYPKDTIDVALFGDEATQVPLHEIASIQAGPYHTNTKAGLELGEKLLLRRKAANRQIFMITDGKPSAITEQGQIYKNPFGLDPKIVARTLDQARHLRRKGIDLTTFMITTDPYLQAFVDDLTRANKGRAYYAALDQLGSFIFADYGRNKKKRV